jgi:hypothetical protein
MQNHLADKRQATLILRLTLDGRGHFMHGEVVDLDGVRIGRFIEWLDLTGLVRVWLTGQDTDDGLNLPK